MNEEMNEKDRTFLRSPSPALLWQICALLFFIGDVTHPFSSRAAESSPERSSPSVAGVGTNEAFIVFGEITDAEGRPLGQVEVVAHCGNGTLFPTGSAVSAGDGRYRLSFGPGMRVGRSFPDAAPLGVGCQAATISARKAGYFIQDLGRAGNLAMTDSTNSAPACATNFAGVVRAFVPYRLDFRLQPGALVRGRLEDPSQRLPPKTSLCLKGEKLPPSSNVLACVDVGNNGEFQFKDVPVGFAFWFEVTWREKEDWKTLRSAAFTATSSTPKNLKILVSDDALQLTETPD